MINKKVPLRMCIACRESKTKENFIRVVKTPDGFIVDGSNKVVGRSCYICKNNDCVNKVIKNKLLHKSFKQDIQLETYEILKEKINND